MTYFHKDAGRLLERARTRCKKRNERDMPKLRHGQRLLYVDARGMHRTGAYVMPAQDKDFLVVRDDDHHRTVAVNVLDVVTVL